MNRLWLAVMALASLPLPVGGAVIVPQAVSSPPVAKAAAAGPRERPAEGPSWFDGDYRVLNVPANGKIVFAPDGRRLAFVSDGKVQVWETAGLVRGGAPVKVFDVPKAVPTAFSPDGQWLALTQPAGLTVVPISAAGTSRPIAKAEKALQDTLFGGWSGDSSELFVVRRKLGAERINLADGKITSVATRAELEKLCGSTIELLGIDGVRGSGDTARVFLVGLKHVPAQDRGGGIGLPIPPSDHRWSFLKTADKVALTDDNADWILIPNQELSRFFILGFKSTWLGPSFQTKRTTLQQLGTADATLKPHLGEKINDLSPPNLQGRAFRTLALSGDASRALAFVPASRVVTIPLDGPDHQKKLEARFADYKRVVQPVPKVPPGPKEMLVFVPVWALYVLDAGRNEVKPLTKFYGEQIDELKDPALVRVDGVYDGYGWSKAAGLVAVSLKSKLFLLKIPAWER
jgi:hypothetical protein